MMIVDWNVPGAPYYVPGKYLPGANNYLDSPPSVSGVVPSGWSTSEMIEFLFPGDDHWHHVHYIATSGDAPTLDQLAQAPSTFFSDWIVLALPEGISNVYFVQHNETHHPKGYETDIGVIGPYQIDDSAPVGSMVIAGGLFRIDEAPTSVEISATDQYSGLYQVYIDGDVQDGPNVRQWIDFSTSVEVDLDATKFGRKFVNLRLKDNAGNISSLVLDDVFLGSTKYYFYNTKPRSNKLASVDHKFSIMDENKMRTDNTPKMQPGEEHGKFNSR